VDESQREEFRAYVAGRGAALLRTAVLMTGDRGLAEDLVQATLIRTYGAWGRIRRREAVDAYARRVMVTTYVNWWHRKWRGELPTESLPEQPAPDAFGQVEDGLSLHDALARLPKRMRAVVVLRYYDDLPDVEIAAMLGCSTGTVRSQAARALAKLRSDGALALDFERDGR
jgi:RNA polymerase sigma-70 factor (sigma-E family)